MPTATTGPTPRFAEAVAFAIERHVDASGAPQVRKETSVPYLAHLLSVAALVWEAGGDEEQAITGVLHDCLEDTETTAEEIAERFGAAVADLVVECSDGGSVDGPRDESTWDARKLTYLAHLGHATPRAQLVCAADKLHNATSIVVEGEDEYARLGEVRVWRKFNASREKVLWYYFGILEALGQELGGTPIYRRLREMVDRMENLAPDTARVGR